MYCPLALCRASSVLMSAISNFLSATGGERAQASCAVPVGCRELISCRTCFMVDDVLSSPLLSPSISCLRTMLTLPDPYAKTSEQEHWQDPELTALIIDSGLLATGVPWEGRQLIGSWINSKYGISVWSLVDNGAILLTNQHRLYASGTQADTIVWLLH
ncbi:hypothetical protein B0T22DRAFT_279337 [Podospora appendiculata]|uniref:Uncharacterized protein n=1 Tax=Podospora appendiculata TaxID=314037 RepID=A0AAE0X0Y0_9PEZI|nr:hypothetical protein B0T22DRAFT_279337 [Podospora appendiculata]